jgi:glycosyltransferase involved in cell wall biosynthesis
MSKQPAISILVPCYNVEKYLRECLDSILNQTFTDFEALCINDGSTDSTLDILKEYAQKDERFKIIDKANSGYGASMNKGLDAATGKYVGIVESDDYIEPQMFERLYNEAEEHSLDVVRCLYREFNDIKGTMEVIDHSDIKLYEFGMVFTPRVQQHIFFIAPSIWAGMYNREFLNSNSIRFLETPGASYQDTAFAFKIYASAERAKVIPDVLHNYRINENSSVNSPGKIYFVCNEEEEIRRYAAERGLQEELKEIMAMRCFGSYRWNYDRLGTLTLKREFMKRWSLELRGMFERGEMTGKYLSKNRRFRLWLAAYCPWVYHFVKKF